MNDKRLTNRPALSRLLITGWTCAYLLSGCGSLLVNQDGAPDRQLDWNSIPDPTPRVEPLSKTGNPPSYVVNGQRYHVTLHTADFTESGLASWYGTKFHGKLTSSGEKYDMYKMTAAHKSLPLPSYVSVKNRENNKEVIVRVNDRGPFVDGRIIDLSYAAAQKLEIVKNGTAKVDIKILASPGLSDSQNVSAIQEVKLSGNGRKYFVQLGAFSEIGNAEKFRLKLASHSIEPTQIRSYSIDDGELHKVQVGPISSFDELKLMESRLLDLGYEQVYVITE